MRFRLIRLRFRRRLRKGSRQIQDISKQAEKGLDKHFFKRYSNLGNVWRFVGAWAALIVLAGAIVTFQLINLSGYYQKLQPVPGGIYNEGVLGTFTNANPLYATSDVDTAVSHLVFAGLLKYNQDNQLTGDLASGYSVNDSGSVYTVKLKPNLTWQDGQPLTADDVVFTYHTIQNPDAESPLNSSWQGIKVSAPDARTIVFELPSPLASFPSDLTNGIVPKHLLSGMAADSLRSADFNTASPVGAGPFSWQAIQVTGGNLNTAQEQIAFKPFANYNAGKPKLQEFVLHAYASQAQLTAAVKSGQLTAAEGLDAVPKGLAGSWVVHSLTLTAATMVFFKTTAAPLDNTQIRQALVQSVDVNSIINNLGYATLKIRQPILSGQVAYNVNYFQSGYNFQSASQLLDQAGWTMGKDHLRYKNGQPLNFTLTARDTPEYRSVAGQLKDYWSRLGVNVTVNFQDTSDFQNAITYHDYQAVLYGITIGTDPDVFVYWDSSQADPRSANRLNLSEYKNPSADVALESGRTRLDPALRKIKYAPFLQAWQRDAPALGLYQPRILYLTNGSVYNLNYRQINSASDRFNNVANWEIHESKVTASS